MKYDFTTLPDRHGRDSIAVDGLGKGFAPDAPQPGFDAIPMWVADMNFVCLPTIQQAVIERVQHPAFGYFDPTPEYYGSIIRWQETRNDVTGLTAEAIGYENGVLGGVISALNCVCSRGDKVLVHSPTYIGFTRCLTDNGYDIVHSPLVQDENGVWRMDYADMEKHLTEEHIHAAILCSPHNPCGRVWERWELEKAMELYKSIMSTLYPTRSGRTSSSPATSTSPPSPSVRTPGCALPPSTPPPRPSTSPVSSAAITSFITRGGVTASRRNPPSATITP